MRISFLPKEEKFFEFFHKQADIIIKAAEILKEISENVEEKLLKKFEEITRLEHEGDDLVHEIVVKLNKTFITPIDREDIHQLAMYMDDILDYMQGSVCRLHLYRIERETPELKQMVDVILESASLIKKGILMLPGFKPEISELRKQMKTLERKADVIYRSVLGYLFNDDTIPVLYVIKWKDIYESLETVTDKCEDVFDILEAVVLKHA